MKTFSQVVLPRIVDLLRVRRIASVCTQVLTSDVGLCQVRVTACPQTRSTRLDPGFFSMGVLGMVTPTSISSQTRTSHGKRTKPLLRRRWSCADSNPRRTKRCFAQDTWVCFWYGVDTDGHRQRLGALVCCKSSHQRTQLRQFCLSRRCEESTDEHIGRLWWRLQTGQAIQVDGYTGRYASQVHLARLWGKASWGPITAAIPLPAYILPHGRTPWNSVIVYTTNDSQRLSEPARKKVVQW